MLTKILPKLKFFLLFVIASLFVLGIWIPSANAQFPNLWDMQNNSEQQPRIQYVQRGNIHIANVRLDGESLFKVAAPASDDRGDLDSILPIEWRVNEIETQLTKIVNSGFDSESLQVKISILNNQTVIVVADRD